MWTFRVLVSQSTEVIIDFSMFVDLCLLFVLLHLRKILAHLTEIQLPHLAKGPFLSAFGVVRLGSHLDFWVGLFLTLDL